jgi:large subunit ribosomal protein L3
MTGHMGMKRETERNLRVAQVDPEKHLLLVKGSVPGPNGGYVLIKKARR